MEQEFDLFIQNILQATGIDLKKYKRPQMERRITSLRNKHGFSNFQAYFDGIILNESLFYEFLDRMTINVSEFFRNQNRWEIVENRIFPDVLKENRSIKIWSAACSTGEEPYTIALILSRFLPLSQIQIVASDIDENAIERAKTGIYPERSIAQIPKDLLEKHFTKTTAGLYSISSQIKQCVSYRKQNLLEDKFEQDFDLIVCRNVVIYFTEEAKHDLYLKFSDSLRPGGILFVGSTEQIFNPASYHFSPYETFFYQKEN